MTKTIITLFDDLARACQAYRALLRAGVARDQISVVANANEELHAEAFGDDDADLLPRDAVTSPFRAVGQVALSGPVARSLNHLDASEFDLVALATALRIQGLPLDIAGLYTEAVRRGGVVLLARVREEEHERVIRAIDAFDTIDIERRAALWRADGWSLSGSRARPAYSADEIRASRDRYRALERDDEADRAARVAYLFAALEPVEHIPAEYVDEPPPDVARSFRMHYDKMHAELNEVYERDPRSE